MQAVALTEFLVYYGPDSFVADCKVGCAATAGVSAAPARSLHPRGGRFRGGHAPLTRRGPAALHLNDEYRARIHT
jgi:hypothetical protein